MDMDVLVMLMGGTNPEHHPLKTDMDARDEEKKRRRRRRKRDVDTHTHTPIEKELYICALTNLPRITHTHTMAASQAYSIFHLSLILFRIFLQRMS